MADHITKNRLRKAFVIFLTAAFVLPFGTATFAGTPYTGSSGNYYLYNISRPLAENDCGNISVIHEASFHFDFATDGETKTSMEERRVRPQYARVIRWGKPKVVSCDYCSGWADNPGLFSVQIFLEDDSGREYIRKSGYELSKTELYSTGLDFEHLDFPIRVGIELTQKPGDYCPYCKRHIGDLVTVDGLMWEMTCIDFSSHPADVPASYGGSGEFDVGVSVYRDVFGRSLDKYKWEMKTDGGEWTQVNDGVSSGGAVFSGSDTTHLVISGIDRSLYGSEFRCALTGANYTKAFSHSGSLVLPVYNTVPTLPPDVTTVPAITPAPGSDTTYIPSSSSSSYVQEPQPSSGSSSTSSSSRGTGGEDTYKGDITPAVSLSETPVSATGGSSSATAAKSGKSTGGSGGNTAKKAAGTSSSSSSSALSAKKPGANYVMKNGVLYIVDDEDTTVGVSSSEPPEEVMESSTENEYSASDLAIEGELYSAGLSSGFWNTPWGYALIGLIALLLIALLLFVLFFGVIVCGEVEEHDEVFELCGIRLLRWREGMWHVNLGTAFDENAVLKLHTGLLFTVIFKEWELAGDVKGLYEGETSAPIERGMLMYRKNIRRSV